MMSVHDSFLITCPSLHCPLCVAAVTLLAGTAGAVPMALPVALAAGITWTAIVIMAMAAVACTSSLVGTPAQDGAVAIAGTTRMMAVGTG